MSETGMVDFKKALVVITLSLKTSPEVYRHSGTFTLCFVPLVNIRYATQNVSKWERLESFALSIETPYKRSLCVLVPCM